MNERAFLAHLILLLLSLDLGCDLLCWNSEICKLKCLRFFSEENRLMLGTCVSCQQI